MFLQNKGKLSGRKEEISFFSRQIEFPEIRKTKKNVGTRNLAFKLSLSFSNVTLLEHFLKILGLLERGGIINGDGKIIMTVVF